MGAIALDSSALLAVLLHEPDAPAMLYTMRRANALLLSAANYVETGIIYDSRLIPGRRAEDVDKLLHFIDASAIPLDLRQAELARTAYRQYGKGRHPAALNICDCFAYALAKSHNAPLLFKGDDFNKTDIESALP